VVPFVLLEHCHSSEVLCFRNSANGRVTSTQMTAFILRCCKMSSSPFPIFPVCVLFLAGVCLSPPSYSRLSLFFFPVNIDCKYGNEELCQKVPPFLSFSPIQLGPDSFLPFEVYELIVKYKREHITIWGSGADEVNKRYALFLLDVFSLHSDRRVLLLLPSPLDRNAGCVKLTAASTG